MLRSYAGTNIKKNTNESNLCITSSFLKSVKNTKSISIERIVNRVMPRAFEVQFEKRVLVCTELYNKRIYRTRYVICARDQRAPKRYDDKASNARGFRILFI